MRKRIFVILCALMLVLIVGCSNNEPGEHKTTEQSETTSNTEPTAEQGVDEGDMTTESTETTIEIAVPETAVTVPTIPSESNNYNDETEPNPDESEVENDSLSNSSENNENSSESIPNDTTNTEERNEPEDADKPHNPDVKFEAVDEAVFATSTVNVRTGPSTDYNKIGQLHYNEQVTRIGIGDNGWSKVIYNGIEAYVHSNYLSREKMSDVINLSNYSKINSYGGLSSKEQQLVKDLLAEYSKYKNGEVDTVCITVDEPLSYESYQMVVSFFAIYFYSYSSLDTVVDYTVYSGQKTEVSLNLDNFNKWYNERSSINSKVNSILSNFTEGSEKHKLQQIVDYLASHTSYSVNKLDASDVLFSGVGNCNGYSMAFQAMAIRLGIQCDICVGYSNSGKHAWNRVILSNGEVLYYDVTYYESSGSSIYIANSSSPWSNYAINNYYYN